MKKFLKTLAVLAAVAALGFGFASCPDDDDGSGSALVAYSSTDSVGGTGTISFYSDKTYTVHMYRKGTEHGKTLTMDLDYEKGSYTADPTKDGSVDCTSVSQVDEDKIGELMYGALLSGKNSLTITNSNCPLVALDSSKVETRTCTISGNGTTLTDDEGNKYTRK